MIRFLQRVLLLRLTQVYPVQARQVRIAAVVLAAVASVLLALEPRPKAAGSEEAIHVRPAGSIVSPHGLLEPVARTRPTPEVLRPVRADDASDWQLLFALARHHGVAIEQTDFVRAADRSGAGLVEEARLAPAGEYARIRAFVIDLLNRRPHIELRELRFQRDARQTERVVATVRLARRIDG